MKTKYYYHKGEQKNLSNYGSYKRIVELRIRSKIEWHVLQNLSDNFDIPVSAERFRHRRIYLPMTYDGKTRRIVTALEFVKEFIPEYNVDILHCMRPAQSGYSYKYVAGGIREGYMKGIV